MKDDSFTDYVLDQLSGLPDVRAKRMFGGHGIYDGIIFFGIISSGILYFKTDETTRTRYIDAGSGCFKPSKKQILKNYYEVPAEVLENPELLLEWAYKALGVASKTGK